MSTFPISMTSQCLFALHRVNTFACRNSYFPFIRLQVRGKKKLVKHAPVKVRLLADVARYGRKGSVISVAAGRMRNHFYPRNMAEYVTDNQLRELGIAKDAFLERDSTFGVRGKSYPANEFEETEGIARDPVKVELLKPERAMEVLPALIPSNIIFYRTPINDEPSPSQRHSLSIPASPAVSLDAQDRIPATDHKSIYGSVTTANIADSINALLAENDEGIRVHISPDNISFVEDQKEKDRVKQSGVFEIAIKIKGAANEIRRTIEVDTTE